MSEHAMPLLIINMGGEMLYILEQRLQAQSIVEEKSLRVLQDVISTMFSEKFVSELFKPQKIYSNSNTRQIFDRLAHSSIMRLNQSSMDKLYDLMTMGFKYQLLLASSPADLLTICLNHLDALKKLIHSPEIMKLLENATNALLDMFKDVKLGQFSLLRQTLARFFQDRRVKVSLFLQDQIQAIDGSIIIHHKGHLPKGGDIPGTIKYYDESGKIIKEELIKLPNADGILPPNLSDNKNHRNTDLGCNLYAKDRRKTKGGTASKIARRGGGNKSTGSGFEADEGGKATAKAELNLLASMIGGSKSSDKDHFNLNLFPDTALGADSNNSDGFSSELIVFDADDLDARKGELEKKFGLTDSGSTGGDDDLLDLMDSAEK